MNPDLEYRHNCNIFAADYNMEIIPLMHDIQNSTNFHDSYKVYNIGRVDVTVSFRSGVNEDWRIFQDEITIKPGQAVTIDNVGKFFFESAIIIKSKTYERALVHCTKGDGLYPLVALKESEEFCDESYYKNLMETYNVGVKYIPISGDLPYQDIINAFWPQNSLSVWEDISKKLQPIVEDDIAHAVFTSFNDFMPSVKRQLKSIAKHYRNENCSRIKYINLVEDLITFEQTLAFKIRRNYSKSVLHVLPLLSNFIFLQTTFYKTGIRNGYRTNLLYTDYPYLRELTEKTVCKAKEFIKKIFDYHLWATYQRSHPEDMYNSLMSTRSYITIHGLEYFFIWDSLRGSPELYECLAYSNFFGRQTPSLVRQATSEKMYPPLTPRYLGFIYNPIFTIEVYLYRNKLSQQYPKIGGMKLTFGDWSSYLMGTETGESEELSLINCAITKLEVTGTGAIDSCTFHINDGRKVSFGTVESYSEKCIFELKDHIISSIFLSSDHNALEGQAANIAVSYALRIKY